MKRTIRNQTGFTLIELLIATMISAIVLAAIMEVFATNYKSYLLQDDVANMQENLRVGMSFLDRDVTMIGSGMVGVDKPAGFQVLIYENGDFNKKQAFPLRFENNVAELNGSDRLTVSYNMMVEGACGSPRNADGVLACDLLPELTLTDRMPEGSSNAEVAEDLKYSKNGCPSDDPTSDCYSLDPRWSESCYCGEDVYEIPQYQADSGARMLALVTAADNSASEIFIVTGIEEKSATGGMGSKVNNHPLGSMGFDNKVIGAYPGGSKISFFTMRTFRDVQYYVQNNNLMRQITTYNNQGAPTVQTPQPIAENVDDFQCAFGLDTDTDGVADQWINDRNLTNAESILVRRVRINLVGRARKPNNTFYTGMQQTIKAATGSPSDTVEDRSVSDIEALAPTVAQKDRFYVRKMLQTTVTVRSLGL